ncbi:MAG: hypothetical protein C9356_15745 [Oleiphilus sp.]|nr:MAG: hypothetical protein C9356_15745 [Oleiphilus sp.]
MIKWFVLVIMAISAVTTRADATITTDSNALCPDAEVFGANMITGICYSCMMPMQLMGYIEFGEGQAPEGASRDITCNCNDSFGMPTFSTTISMWMPQRVYEIVKVPFCSPTLAGTVIGSTTGDLEGMSVLDIVGQRPSRPNEVTERTRYHLHAFEFPLLTILKLFANVNCMNGGVATVDMALAPSELLPTWNDEELSLLTAAECTLAANPLMAPLCSIDGVSSTLFCSPMDSLPYCAGFWGLTCPMSGHVNAPVNSTIEQSLLKARYIQYNHRMGVLEKTYGEDAFCSTGGFAYTIPKQQYRFSMLYPVKEASPIPAGQPGGNPPDADINESCTGSCCHYLGEHHWKWGLGRKYPGPGENSVYMGFQYHQCCNTLIGGS